MKGLLITIGMSVGGYIGWYIGMLSGYGLAIVLSGLGTGYGMYLSQKIAKNYMG